MSRSLICTESDGAGPTLLSVDNMLVVEAFKKQLHPEFEIMRLLSDSSRSPCCWPKVMPDVVVVDIVICVHFLMQRFCSVNDVNDPTARTP